jgi:hypothetical protein
MEEGGGRRRKREEKWRTKLPDQRYPTSRCIVRIEHTVFTYL